MSEAVEVDPTETDPEGNPLPEGDPEPELEPEGEPEQEDEPEPEPQPEPGEDEARHRMIDKALEKEHKRHERTLSALYAEEWESRVMCPLCIGEGFVLPYRPGELPAEQLDAMDALSGRYSPPEYVEDSDYEGCSHCDGQGHTITGSKNPEHVTKLCDKCSGNGFVRKAPSYAPVTPIHAQVPETPQAPQAPVSYGATGNPDQWGRPPGHVHYGIEPQFVTA